MDGSTNSSFAQRLLDHGTYCTMEGVMGILYFIEKGVHVSTLEKFHMCKETKSDKKLNDKNSLL
jgi:hypothetical protein